MPLMSDLASKAAIEALNADYKRFEYCLACIEYGDTCLHEPQI